MTEITVIDDDNNGPKNYSKGYLTLPFEGDQFKNFISSLLGKPQIIKKEIYGLFELYLKDIQNFFDLINQRVLQQNNGQLIQFITNIYFDDGSSIQLGSYEELITFNEIKPSISVSVRLTWIYLIQFPDKSYPEKQTIELLISSGNRRRRYLYEDEDIISRYSIGAIKIQIEYTARTWGIDLMNTIENQIATLLKETNKYKEFIRSKNEEVGLFFGILLFAICFIGSIIITNSFIENQLLNVRSFSQKSHSINEKINFLLTYVANGAIPSFYYKIILFLITMILISIIIGIWVSIKAKKFSEESFLILTRSSKNYKDGIVKIERKEWTLFVLSIVTSIITGLIGNYIFKWLIEK